MIATDRFVDAIAVVVCGSGAVAKLFSEEVQCCGDPGTALVILAANGHVLQATFD
jgi:hypothetical protein